MIEVQPSEDGRSFVILMQGMPVFRGTMRECEDWLDFRENRPADGRAESSEPEPPSSADFSSRPVDTAEPLPDEDGLGRSA